MLALVISLFLVSYLILLLVRPSIALFFLGALLPTYVVRFSIGPLPTTLLEGMLLLTILVFGIRIHKKPHREKLKLIRTEWWRSSPSLLFATTLFAIGATIGVLVSLDMRSALGAWKALYMEPIALAIVLVAATKTQVLEKENLIRSLVSGLLLGGLVTAVFAIYQHLSGGNFVPYSFWQNRNTYRVTGWYGYPNAVGLYLAPLFLLALYTLADAIKHLKQVFSLSELLRLLLTLLFLPLALIAIWYAKSTGALVGIVGGMGFLLLLYQKTRWPAMVLGIIGIAVVLFLPKDLAIRQELLMQDRSGQLRRDMWAETVEFLKTRPLTGAGLTSYSERIAPYRIDKKIEIFHLPHNIFLSTWVTVGLLGLIGFVWLMLWFFKTGIQTLKTDASEHTLLFRFLLATMTVILVMGLVDTPYIKNDLAVLFWLMVAFLASAETGGIKTEPPSPDSPPQPKCFRV